MDSRYLRGKAAAFWTEKKKRKETRCPGWVLCQAAIPEALLPVPQGSTPADPMELSLLRWCSCMLREPPQAPERVL